MGPMENVDLKTTGTCQFCNQPITLANHSISKLVGECWHTTADDEPLCFVRMKDTEDWEHLPLAR